MDTPGQAHAPGCQGLQAASSVASHSHSAAQAHHQASQTCSALRLPAYAAETQALPALRRPHLPYPPRVDLGKTVLAAVLTGAPAAAQKRKAGCAPH
eukprot:1151898-Pelagomonas_calceolata.AAC.5